MTELDVKALTPKPGYLTSSFLLWLATFIGGGVITFAIRKGLPQDVAEANRSVIISAINDLLPLVWLAVVGTLGRAYMATRRIVTQGKVDALVEAVKQRVAS
jgi:hypothetical protein